MSEGTQKTLFFIKNPSANLSAIELYLKKRDFNVFSESDLKTALLEIMKISPDYIFLAWDHPNERIVNIPKYILQSMMTTMIAYCTSNEKIQIRKLQGSGQTHKLFPPLSGPAIQRLISKLEKENLANSADPVAKKTNSSNMQNQSDMIQVKSSDKNKDLDQFMNSLSETESKPSEIYIDKGLRAKELRNKQNITKPSNLLYLAPVQDIVSSTEHKMSESLQKKLDQKFDEQIKLPLEELFETLKDHEYSANEPSILKNETLTIAKYGYCVVVEHKNWNGYLIVASESDVDPVSLESVLTNWINENLEDSNEDVSVLSHGFEVSLSDISYEIFSEKFADYTKTLTLNDKKTVLSFFSVTPEMMHLQLHDDHDMIEILTAEIPISLPVPFDLHLYLPENRKFILYSKKDSLVANIQIDRLKEKKVDKLYSSLDFENKVQKFRAEKRISRLIEKFKDVQKNI